jgi:hypothetical protein
MQHRNIKIYFCNIIMKYLQHFFETTETHQTFACNIGVKPDILTSEQFAARLASTAAGERVACTAHPRPRPAPPPPCSATCSPHAWTWRGAHGLRCEAARRGRAKANEIPPRRSAAPVHGTGWERIESSAREDEGQVNWKARRLVRMVERISMLHAWWACGRARWTPDTKHYR